MVTDRAECLATLAEQVTRVKAIQARLEQHYTEVLDSEPPRQPDLTSEGLERTLAIVQEALAQGERASVVVAETVFLSGVAASIQVLAQRQAQAVTDELVEQLAHLYPTLSWEERGAKYRVRAVEVASVQAALASSLRMVEGLREAILDRAKAIRNRRFEYELQLGVFRLAGMAGDLPSSEERRSARQGRESW